jgi:hypothetical protein
VQRLGAERREARFITSGRTADMALEYCRHRASGRQARHFPLHRADRTPG